jgi:hypothetical protein
MKQADDFCVSSAATPRSYTIICSYCLLHRVATWLLASLLVVAENTKS